MSTLAEWHAADLADVGVYEDDGGPHLAHLMMFDARNSVGPTWGHGLLNLV